MSGHAYTEDQLVEQPAIGLFAELGWQTVSALEETFGATGTLLRETKGEVVLVSRLRAALERLNPALPPEAITAAVDELTRDRSAMSLEAANREVYRLLKEGIPVSVLERDSASGRAELPLRPNVPGGAATPPYQKGGQTTVRVQVIDWEQPANNDFLLVIQFSVTGALYTCRPDLVCFVLTRPAPELSTEERAEVKKVARDLLARLNALLVLNWRQKSTARSQLRLTIEDVLDNGLPRTFDKPLYEQKCGALFEHVFENYHGEGAGTYATAA